jgi:hypothetical protein
MSAYQRLLATAFRVARGTDPHSQVKAALAAAFPDRTHAETGKAARMVMDEMEDPERFDEFTGPWADEANP